MPTDYVLPKNANSPTQLAKIGRQINSATAPLGKKFAKPGPETLGILLGVMKDMNHLQQCCGKGRAFNQLRAHQNQMKEVERSIRRAAMGDLNLKF